MLKVKKKGLFKIVLATGVAFSAWPSLSDKNPTAYASETSNVLMNENFDGIANGSVPEGWKLLQGNASVNDGKLVLSSPSSSSPARVIVPLSKKDGDFVFEADMTFQAAADDARWASIMYRIQSGNYPYYQFAVRRNTTALNGLEFAMRNEKNQWEVPESTFYPEKFAFNKTYRLKVVSSKNRVQQFINDKLVIDTDLATKWPSGDVGFQANGTTVQFDNVKVTSQTIALPPIENSNAFIPKEAETTIINPPTLISSSKTNTESEIASAVLPVHKNSDGTLMVNEISLKDKLAAIKNKLIPVIQLEEDGLEDETIRALNETQTIDVHIISSKDSILQTFKNKFPTARIGLIYRKKSFTKSDLEEYAKQIHQNNSKTAIIEQKNITPEVVHYLHSRTIAIWGIGTESSESAHELIHLGVDGIISSKPEYTSEALTEYPEKTIIQRPIVAAHRGVPSLSPENTMTSYRQAYDLGADLIETDVQKTKDGHLVIMHDYTVNRTTNGTGNVKDLTLDQIQQLDAGVKFGPEFQGEKVPTFKEYLQEFKDKEVVLLVELKAADIEQQVIDEIEEEGMADKVVIQSFNLDSVKNSKVIKPEIGTGYLYSSAVPATENAKLKKAQQMLLYGTSMNTSLNASYSSLYQEFITYMRQRGMLNMHWTYRNEEHLHQSLNAGIIGPITDYTQWLTKSPIMLETPVKKVKLEVGNTKTIDPKAKVSYRMDKKEKVPTTLYATGKEEIIQIEGNNITALAPGKVNVYVKHTFKMLGHDWNVVAEPIEVTISE
ncbi:glycerophosphodiester phosphodiesterase family protein [Peribacillus cavernae]|nr:glycerophosphodiester phosphodiesterase family protein [Peribacillus cavernae]MDQ0218048.1 glycerophosphoryl diester phosphodiesterase [Peribacillus cavernae]